MHLRPILLAVSVVGVVSTSPVQANEALLKKYNCVACHQIDKKSVGPAYKDVAKKYKGQKDAPATLAQKVKKGGQGVWGKIPMPPNSHVPDADIKQMVEYILKL